MTQINYIQEIAKFGLMNDTDSLLKSLNELIDFYKNSKKNNLALKLQSVIKDAKQYQGKLTKVGSDYYFQQRNEKEISELVIDKFRSEYSLKDLIADKILISDLKQFIKENQSVSLLQKHELPVSNKLLLHGPSGCGKTLASYVIAGELERPMYVINLGAIVSSKLGETGKNLAKVFKYASQEESIIFIDEFDSIGKLRDYNQDHGEMKRVVNTILQLFDFLPERTIVIAATNQEKMIDEALLRRFDVNLKFSLPGEEQIKELINLTLRNSKFQKPADQELSTVIKKCKGLSYYSIQKTLVNTVKKTLLDNLENKKVDISVNFKVWLELIEKEKKALKVD